MNNKVLSSKTAFPVAVFCPPQAPSQYAENRINDKTFSILSECGVSIIYGMNEAFGGEWEGYAFRAMDLCAKYGMTYFAQDAVFTEFCTFEGFKNNAVKPFYKLMPAEREDLKQRYLRSLARYINHPACEGVIFFDEPGLKSLDGIGFAREIFKEKYPDKIFYINNFSYALNKTIMNYGIMLWTIENPETEIPQIPEYTHENRFVCYDYYMENMIKKVNPDIFSFDLYPVQQLGGIKNAIHKGFFELAAYYYQKSHREGKPFWNFIQCGSWSLGETGEQYEVGYSEAALQINASLALGARGLALFPGCYPNDWLSNGSIEPRKDTCGITDRHGEVTENYFIFKKAVKNAQAAAPYLLTGEYLGAALYGRLPPLLPETGVDMPQSYNDCAYTGEDFLGNMRYVDSAVKEVTSDSQILLSVTKRGNSKVLFAVNMSNLTATRVSFVFDKEYDITILAGGVAKKSHSNSCAVPLLRAGEAAVIELK